MKTKEYNTGKMRADKIYFEIVRDHLALLSKRTYQNGLHYLISDFRK